MGLPSFPSLLMLLRCISLKTLDQVLSYQNKLAANFIVLTNGLKTYCIEIDLELQKASYITEIPEYSIG